MNFHLPDIQLLRNNIDFCSIAQFFHTFAAAFGPWPSTVQDIVYARHAEPNNDYVFETEDLERMLLETSERIRLEDLFARMLRLLAKNRLINSSNWQTYYSKEFDKREYDHVNPFIMQQDKETTNPTEGAEPETKTKELVNYFTLDLDTRVHLLHLLCEWQLDEPERFRERLDSEEDAVQWRVDPIGFDKKGSTFWLFDDNRLYKETPKPKPVKKSNARNKKKKHAAVPLPPPPARSSRRSTRSSTTQEEQEPVQEHVEEDESEDEGEWVPWKLLCYTKYEWENFPSKYANSKNIDEQRFYKLLVDDLLPKVIPVLEEHQDKIKKQEAIIHRKRSSRILIKEMEALGRGSVEPMLEDPYSPSIGGGRNRSNRLEQRSLEKEQQEKEAMAKAREERLLEREKRLMEREYRASKRQASEEVVLPEPTAEAEHPRPIIIDGTSPLPTKETKLIKKSEAEQEQKPKRKYVKKPKFDEHGNPIPKKVKLDKDGNPIPLKKRGRKPKNRDEDSWLFDCACGVSGENIDDGTPLVACERCGTWQHIACLEKSGQIPETESIDNLKFACQKCTQHQEEQEREPKRQRDQHYTPPSTAGPSQPIPVAQQHQQQAYPPIRSHPPNQAPAALHQQHPPSPIYNPLASHHSPPQQLQQPQHGTCPSIAMHPSTNQQQQPLLNSSHTYPQATASQQQTIQSIVSQVASNPHSLAQLANLLDKNLQQKRQ